MAFVAAGQKQLLAVQGVGENWLWALDENLSKGECLSLTPAPSMFQSQDIALSPNGGLLAETEVYKQGKSTYFNLRLRSTTHPKQPLATIEVNNGVGALAFSPTKPILAVSDYNGWVADNRKKPAFRLYDIADPRRPRQIAEINTTTYSLRFSPDGKTLVMNEPSPTRVEKASTSHRGTTAQLERHRSHAPGQAVGSASTHRRRLRGIRVPAGRSTIRSARRQWKAPAAASPREPARRSSGQRVHRHWRRSAGVQSRREAPRADRLQRDDETSRGLGRE